MNENKFEGIGAAPVERINDFRDLILNFISEIKSFFGVMKDVFDYEDILNRYESLVYCLDKSYTDLSKNELISLTLKEEIAEDLLNNFDTETLFVTNRIKNDLNVVVTNTSHEDDIHQRAEGLITLITSLENSILDFTEKTRDLICFGETFDSIDDEDFDSINDEDFDSIDDEDFDSIDDEEFNDTNNGISIHYGNGMAMEFSWGIDDDE